jgi:hypothetical protein
LQWSNPWLNGWNPNIFSYAKPRIIYVLKHYKRVRFVYICFPLFCSVSVYSVLWCFMVVYIYIYLFIYGSRVVSPLTIYIYTHYKTL